MEDDLKKNYKLKDLPERYLNLIERIKPIAKDYAFRWSFNGVPHLLVDLANKGTYSLCYFGKSKTWRAFWPYPSESQQKRTFASEEDLITFLKEEQ